MTNFDNQQETILQLKDEIQRLKSENNEVFRLLSEFQSKASLESCNLLSQSHILFQNIIDDALKSNKSLSKLRISKEMGISQGRLYELLNGKRLLTEFHLEEIAKFFQLENEVIQKLSNAVEEDRKRIKQIKSNITKAVNQSLTDNLNKVVILEKPDNFSSWLYYALLTFVGMPSFDQSRNSMYREFNVPQEEIDIVIDCLVENKFLIEDGDKLLTNTDQSTICNKGQDRRKVTISHIEQTLNVYKSLEIPGKDSSIGIFNGFFVVGDHNRAKKAGEMLDEAIIKVAKYLGSGEKNTVYSLTSQIAPFTKIHHE